MLKTLEFAYDVFVLLDSYTIVMTLKDNNCISVELQGYYPNFEKEKTLSLEESKEIVELLEKCEFKSWDREYHMPVLDGFTWNLKYIDTSNERIISEGSNAFPNNFYYLIKAILLVQPNLERMIAG